MPATNNLQWFDLKEFGGLWTAGASSMMPANKAQVMSGCHPQPGGGLRAFLKVADTATGESMHGAPTGEVVAAFTASPLAGTTGTTVFSPNFFVVTVGGFNAVDLPGAAADYISTPDAAGLDIPGDIDLRIKVALDDWTPSALNTLISNMDAAGFKGYEFRVNTSGNLVLVWGNGASVLSMTSTAATGITNGTAKWTRVTLDVNDGAGNRVANFYTSTDGISWSALGATVTTAGTTSISASANTMRIGSRPDGSSPLAGLVYAAEIYNGIAGTLVAGPRFAVMEPGATSIQEFTSGAVWTLNGAASVVYGATLDGDTDYKDWNLWRRESGAGSWEKSLGTTFGGSSSAQNTPPPAQPQFARMTLGSGGHRWFMSLSIREAGDVSGVYEVVPWDGSTVRNTTGLDDNFGAVGLVEHQARLVTGYKDTLKFTPPGSTDFGAAGSGTITLNPQGWVATDLTSYYEGSLVAWLVAVPPGDLIVATRDGRIYNVQGDLSDPTVRELGRWTTSLRHEPTVTPNGVFFIVPNRGVTALGLDGSTQGISDDILPAVWNPKHPKIGLGQIVGTEQFLFCPNQHTTADHKNGALVYDHATKAWFTSTHSDDYNLPNPRFMQADSNPRNSGIWVVSGVAPGAQGLANPMLFQYRVGGYDNASASTEERASTWEYKTAPLREPSGRYLSVRRVEIPAYAFNSSTSTLAVTVGGTTISKTLPAGRSIQTYLFKVQDTILDVKVKAKSNSASIEAPMIESLRVGWQPGPLL